MNDHNKLLVKELIKTPITYDRNAYILHGLLSIRLDPYLDLLSFASAPFSIKYFTDDLHHDYESLIGALTLMMLKRKMLTYYG